jgi:hypothetical protein
MPDTTLSLVKSDASQQLTGRVTLLERQTALDALADFAGQARNGEGQLVLVEGEADPYFYDGVAYCEDHDLGTYYACLRGVRTLTRERLGRWDESAGIAEAVLATVAASPVNRMFPMTSLAKVAARRGGPDVARCARRASAATSARHLQYARSRRDGADHSPEDALARHSLRSGRAASRDARESTRPDPTRAGSARIALRGAHQRQHCHQAGDHTKDSRPSRLVGIGQARRIEAIRGALGEPLADGLGSQRAGGLGAQPGGFGGQGFECLPVRAMLAHAGLHRSRSG